MRREFSAGGVLVRRLRGEWVLAAIRPGGKPEGLWVLPKGQIDEGETGEAAAVREVAEETGVQRASGREARRHPLLVQLGGRAVFKVVSFFLVRYESGRLGDIREEFRHEVADVRWLPLADAPRLLAYRGEREMAATRDRRAGREERRMIRAG